MANDNEERWNKYTRATKDNPDLLLVADFKIGSCDIEAGNSGERWVKLVRESVGDGYIFALLQQPLPPYEPTWKISYKAFPESEEAQKREYFMSKFIDHCTAVFNNFKESEFGEEEHGNSESAVASGAVSAPRPNSADGLR